MEILNLLWALRFRRTLFYANIYLWNLKCLSSFFLRWSPIYLMQYNVKTQILCRRHCLTYLPACAKPRKHFLKFMASIVCLANARPCSDVSGYLDVVLQRNGSKINSHIVGVFAFSFISLNCFMYFPCGGFYYIQRI